MDGTIAQLDKISELAKKYNALVMSDECHSTGFIGEKGRGVHELKNVMGKVDIITGTLGKALGGASGGFTSSKKEVIVILRQKSRPYLFSNTLAPSIVGAGIKAFELLSRSDELRQNSVLRPRELAALRFSLRSSTKRISSGLTLVSSKTFL